MVGVIGHCAAQWRDVDPSRSRCSRPDAHLVDLELRPPIVWGQDETATQMATQRSTPRVELTAFCEELRRAHIRPERMFLFGSWARGQQREDSDIDVIVVSRDFARMGYRRRLEILGIAAGRAWVSVQALGYTPEELAAPEETSFLAIVLAQKTVEVPVPRARPRTKPGPLPGARSTTRANGLRR